MKQLLHYLYITEEKVALKLNGEAVEAYKDDVLLTHIPLINLEGIVSFSYIMPSMQLLEKCTESGVSVIMLNRNGEMRFRVVGKTHGNPELRMKQYERSRDKLFSLEISKAMIIGKIKNCIFLLKQSKRNHKENAEVLTNRIAYLKKTINSALVTDRIEKLRGIEGIAAKVYFDTFNDMIRSQDEKMHFEGRKKRPPTDACNALLSLTYTLLNHLCVSALETAGLDPFIGVMHEMRSGKPSLALDMMEELRPLLADRFVLRLINLGILDSSMFLCDDTGVKLTKTGLKIFFFEWEKWRRNEVEIYGETESIEAGLLPFFLSYKLSRVVYGKDEQYQPYSPEK